jgi:hypothetical protein
MPCFQTNVDHGTVSLLKSSIFWDIMPCSPLKVNRRFGGTCRLHLQARRISKVRNQRESRCQAFSGLHDIIYQRIELFINTAVRTSNPAFLLLVVISISHMNITCSGNEL